MSTNKFNYSKADKIINIYSALLRNASKLEAFDKYGYGSMQGYSAVDINNSYCLKIAYEVYIVDNINEKKIEELKRKASIATEASSTYFSLFIPDNEKLQLDKLDKKSHSFLGNSLEIISDFSESEAWENSKKTRNCNIILKFLYWD